MEKFLAVASLRQGLGNVEGDDPHMEVSQGRVLLHAAGKQWWEAACIFLLRVVCVRAPA